MLVGPLYSHYMAREHSCTKSEESIDGSQNEPFAQVVVDYSHEGTFESTRKRGLWSSLNSRIVKGLGACSVCFCQRLISEYIILMETATSSAIHVTYLINCNTYIAYWKSLWLSFSNREKFQVYPFLSVSLLDIFKFWKGILFCNRLFHLFYAFVYVQRDKTADVRVGYNIWSYQMSKFPWRENINL